MITTLNWKAFDIVKPAPQSDILITDGNGVMRGVFEWFKDYEDWPQHVKPQIQIVGKWVENPTHWEYISVLESSVKIEAVHPGEPVRISLQGDDIT